MKDLQKIKLHWFPLYVDDWIVGTRAMSYLEQGIYMQLLLLQFDLMRPFTYEEAKRYIKIDHETGIESEAFDYVLSTKFDHATFLNERTEKCAGLANARMSQVIEHQIGKNLRKRQQTEHARKIKEMHQVKQIVDDKMANHVLKTSTTSVTERELEPEPEPELELKPEPQTKILTVTEGGLMTLEQAMEAWNEVAKNHKELRVVVAINELREKRWARNLKRKGYLDKFEAALKQIPIANDDSFKWQPTFDWCMREANCDKLIEGNYRKTTREEEIVTRATEWANE